MFLHRSSAKTVGTLLFVGGAQFSILMIAAEAIFPGYSVSGNYISDLGVWSKPSAIIFNPSIMVFGLFLLLGAYYAQHTSKMRPFSVYLGLAGLGGLGVGIFPEDTFLVNGIPVFHSIFALLAFTFGGISAISCYGVVKDPFRYLSMLLGIASLFALVLFMSTEPYGYLGLGVGGMERIIVYPTLMWTIGLGGYILSSSDDK
jgi:hypothetical membrane protein